MAKSDPLLRSMQRTWNQAEDFTSRGQPLPPWLKKKKRAIHLMETDWKAGLDLLTDGELDERDALREVLSSLFPDSLKAEEDVLNGAGSATLIDGLEELERAIQQAEWHG